MRHEDYKALYETSWQQPDKRLHELAVEYHSRCEAYDRTVCSGPVIDGSIMPGDYREHGLIAHHADKVRTEIVRRGNEMGFSKSDIIDAIIRVAGEG
jgi:hypothetical protein